MRKRFKLPRQKRAWGPAISWLITLALISLGWIFFRANSLSQAAQMFHAVLAPASYLYYFLPSSLYLLVGTLAMGYALTLLVTQALDRYSSGKAISGSVVISVLARDRWVWVAPLYFFLMLAVLVLLNRLPRTGPGPFMYAGY